MHLSDLRHGHASLQEKLAYLYTLRTGSKVNWDQYKYISLLERLGNPHKNLPPVIHVAGTNGKGSTIALLRSILEEQGYMVHAYTSPHLVKINERFVIAGQQISDEVLEQKIDALIAQYDLEGLSFFEITTAIGFDLFAEHTADVVLLEVGMGGRLDCTNVIESPLVGVISRISNDHSEFLGDTLSEIAAEKAGIIKPGVPCVLGYQGEGSEEIFDVVRLVSTEKSSIVCAYGDDWSVEEGDLNFVFRFKGESHCFPLPALHGIHQIYNAGLALAALEAVRDYLPVSDDAIRKGLVDVHWAGRLQVLDPVALGLPETCEVWLDSGHNDSAGEMLAAFLKMQKEKDEKPVCLVLGMLGTKNPVAFLEPMLPFVDDIHLVPIAGETNILTPERLQSHAGHLLDGIDVTAHSEVKKALQTVQNTYSEPFRILICGSCYLSGDVLNLLENN